MREIKFRGININTGNWVHGAYLKHQSYMPYPIGASHNKEEDYIHLILTSGFADWGMKRGIDCFAVHEESVGQYTGLKDKNGKEIYEGDTIKSKVGTIANIYCKNGAFVMSNENSNIYLLYDLAIEDGSLIYWEVVGNIYRNKESEEL